MVKMIGAVLVLTSAYALGCLFALKLKEQERWMKEIKLALFLLQGELEYRQLPLPDALERAGNHQRGCLEVFFKNMSMELNKREGIPLKELWKRQSEQFLKNSPLSREQREEFGELGVCFAETDKETRKQTLNFYLNRLEEELKVLRETGGEKEYLYRALGMLGGMFLVILTL